MLFKQYVNVPANTTAKSPVWQQFKVTKGTITQWLIFSDPEAADLLHFKLSYQGSQIIPFRGNEWLEGFLQPVTLTENIELNKPPYVLDVRAYNEDDTFRHEVWIYVNIVKQQSVELPEPSEGAVNKFMKLFNRND